MTSQRFTEALVAAQPNSFASSNVPDTGAEDICAPDGSVLSSNVGSAGSTDNIASAADGNVRGSNVGRVGFADNIDSDTNAEDRVADLTDEQRRALKFWVKLARAHAAIASQATADISRHGLTLAEFGILEVLYHRGPMLLGEVQRRILVSSGGITFLLDRLTAKGLVERRACDTDKRARYATLTDQGVRLVANIFPVHADAIVKAVSGLDESELKAASALLRQVGLAAAGGALQPPKD